jgi:hypothetical protein
MNQLIPNPNIILSDSNSAAIEEILPKLAILQEALETNNPDIAGYMKAIKQNLSMFPDLVHLLSDEQIKPIYSAARAVSQVVIATKAAKKKTEGKASQADNALLRSLL